MFFVKWRARRRAAKVSGQKAQSTFQVKDIVTISIAVISFLISVATAYNVFRQTDDLRGVLNSFPWLEIYPERSEISVKGIVDMLFINAGNRPIAVLGITLPIYDGLKLGPPAFLEDKRLCSAPKSVGTDLEPFVIKEREIIHKQAKILIRDHTKSVAKDGEDGQIIFSVPPTSQEMPEYRAQLALCVHLATPSDANAHGMVELNQVAMFWKGGSITGGLRVEQRPQLLWYRRWSVFFD